MLRGSRIAEQTEGWPSADPSPNCPKCLDCPSTDKAQEPGYPFKLWTLERIQTAFQEGEGVHLSDSTIWEWVLGEGFRWKRQESWFHDAEKADPGFVEKGEHHHGLPNPNPRHAGHPPGRNATGRGEDLSRRRMERGSEPDQL